MVFVAVVVVRCPGCGIVIGAIVLARVTDDDIEDDNDDVIEDDDNDVLRKVFGGVFLFGKGEPVQCFEVPHDHNSGIQPHPRASRTRSWCTLSARERYDRYIVAICVCFPIMEENSPKLHMPKARQNIGC